MKSNFREPHYKWPELSDFYITIIFALMSVAINFILNKISWSFFYAVCKEKKDEEIRKAKTLKACNSFYKSLYFMSAAAWGYYILKDEKYLPRSLLGHGDLSLMNDNYPVHHWPIGLRCYYLGTMGYHVHQLFQHAMHPMRNDFIEMFLHHVVTLTLYSFSYMTNMTAAGSMIMYLHDWADVFAGLVRCFTETTILPISVFAAIGMTLSWFYTRILVFPFIIYYACFHKDIYLGADFIGA